MIHQFKKKLFFCSWLAATRESKKAALFFKHREHGEDGEIESEWFYPEGQDPISLLPRKVSIKVRLVKLVVCWVAMCYLCSEIPVCDVREFIA